MWRSKNNVSHRRTTDRPQMEKKPLQQKRNKLQGHSKNEVVERETPKDNPGVTWEEVRVEGDDLNGLSWILKMHAEKRFLRNDTQFLESELAWAKEKFETIGQTGKSNLLFYLGVKTGSELSTHTEENGKTKINLKGRNDEHKIVLHTPSGAISIFSR